ncbi:MAG: hypothetical protein WCG26_01410 [Chloroflexales bacterium]
MKNPRIQLNPHASPEERAAYLASLGKRERVRLIKQGYGTGSTAGQRAEASAERVADKHRVGCAV